ncbi:MAG: HigA family addiction module antidote protein [Spirochaetaceae bacterium]|jgi:addiction module HigA family antidote|nr:HigA family addiction module antidote protein [Spirochaetaceae bacterium]
MAKSSQTPGSALSALLDKHELNPFSLSKQIGMSNSAVRQIVTGTSKVTVPTALRLAKFFGTSPDYWLDLQRETDYASAAKDRELQADLKTISKVSSTGKKTRRQ